MLKKQYSFIVESIEHLRIDKYLSKKILDISRNRISELLKSKLVMVNGKAVKPSYKVSLNDRIILEIPTKKMNPSIEPEKMEIEIIYEDKYLAVINKPAGLVVHPSPGHSSHTLVNALLYKFNGIKNIGCTDRPGIVHRLDKDTSGLLIIAKQEKTHADMVEIFAKRNIEKKYLAIVKNSFSPQYINKSFKIENYLGRSRTNRKKIGILTPTKGRYALSIITPLWSDKLFSLVSISIKTGRTHQIRVHLSSIKHPVYGDTLYSRKTTGPLYLYACYLKFIHPSTGKLIEIKLKPPEFFIRKMTQLKIPKEVLSDYLN